jgi:type II secretory pathway component PulM
MIAPASLVAKLDALRALSARLEQATLEVRTSDRAAAEATLRKAVDHAKEQGYATSLQDGLEALAKRLDGKPEHAADAAHFRAMAGAS